MFPQEQCASGDVIDAPFRREPDLVTTVAAMSSTFEIYETPAVGVVSTADPSIEITVDARQTTVVELSDGSTDVLYPGESETYEVELAPGDSVQAITAGGVVLRLVTTANYVLPPDDEFVHLSFDAADISTAGASGRYRASIADLSGNGNTAWLDDFGSDISEGNPGFVTGTDALDGNQAFTAAYFDGLYYEGKLSNSVNPLRRISWKDAELPYLLQKDAIGFTASWWALNRSGDWSTTWAGVDRVLFWNSYRLNLGGYLFARIEQGSEFSVSIRQSSGSVRKYVSTGGKAISTVGDQDWHHFALRYVRGGVTELIVDGATVVATDGLDDLDLYQSSASTTSQTLFYDPTGLYLDHFRAYARALSGDEIAALRDEPRIRGWPGPYA